MKAEPGLAPRRSLAAFALVVVSLLLLSTIPYLTFRDIELLRNDSQVLEPARDLVDQLEVSIARGDRDGAMQVLGQLSVLAPRLHPAIHQRVAEVQRAVLRNDASAAAAADGLHAVFRSAALTNTDQIVAAQRQALAWSVALFMVTLVSMMAVGWMVWRQRLLVEQIDWVQAHAERSAHDEQVLREAASAVAAPLTTKDVVEQIALGAIKAANADAAYAARLEKDASLRVIAVSGDCAVAIDQSIAYQGSIIEDIIHSGNAAMVHDFPVDHHVSRAIVVPMVESDGPIGVLTLLYDSEVDESTLPMLLARASTFGDLAAIALKKAHLLEESEHRRLQLEAVERSRARLLRGFSHDIRNPLANADGFLQLLQMGLRGPLPDAQLQTLQRARFSLNTGLRLLSDLLEFALLSVGRIPLNIEAVEVDELLLDVLENHRANAESKQITLAMMQGATVAPMQTDRDRVRQVLDNLLSNAVKYTPKGGEIVVASNTSSQDFENRPGEWLRINIQDNGVGIPADKQQEVFQEFTRLGRVDEAGAGIGLAISQWLAHALGGEITLASEPGIGSTFTLWLPVAPPLAREAPQTPQIVAS